MPPLSPPPRDTRLDLLRGWLQLSIFVSHVPGSGFRTHAIHAAWGLSDSSEIFVLLSGFELGSLYALKVSRSGTGAAWRDLRGRIARLWGRHLVLFLALGAAVFGAEFALGLLGEAASMGWSWLLAEPLAALPSAAAGLYQPEYTGILVLFVWCMALLPAFAWAEARVGAWALLPPALLYAAVQATGWSLPALGGTGIAFNPLSWSLIFLLGAFYGRRALVRGRAVGRHAVLVAAAAAMVAFGLWYRLAEAGIMPGILLDPSLILGKEDLALPRLLHALSLAYLFAVLVAPNPMPARGGFAQALAAAGRRSLDVFCTGILLSYAIGLVLRLHSQAVVALDLLLVPGGAALLLLVAMALERRRAGARSAIGAVRA